MKNHLRGALLVAAATLFVANGAYADKPSGSDKAEKAADKAADKAEKAGDKAADKAEKGIDKAKSAEDRAARKAKQHDGQREKLKATLKKPVDDALKQELRRHAERVARLERIKTVAETEKDTETVAKSGVLLEKENARHEKWMTKYTSAPGATPAVTDPNGGAK